MWDFKSIFTQKTQGLSIFPRRFGIKEGKTHLYGPPKSGKSSLALQYAKEYKYPVYIDCLDSRNDLELITQELLKVFLEKKIDLLVVDNYSPSFILPNFRNIVLITRNLREGIPDGFQEKQIFPLSFEEYISVNREQIPINQLLNTFIKFGNFPELIGMSEYQRMNRIQEICQLVFGADLPILLALLPFQSRSFSIHQLYLQIKKSFKISKDKLYEMIYRLESQGFLTLVPTQKSTQKERYLYFYNFALPYALSPSPYFQAIFENMVFLELKSQYPNTTIYKENGAFVVEKTLFYALAFPNPNILERISKNLSTVVIIALNPMHYENVKILDFTSFALREME